MYSRYRSTSTTVLESVLRFGNLKDTAEQPFVRLMIVANQAEDKPTAEVIPTALPRVPSLPFIQITHENIKRLLRAIPDGEVNLVFVRIVYRQNAVDCDIHCSSAAFNPLSSSVLQNHSISQIGTLCEAESRTERRRLSQIWVVVMCLWSSRSWTDSMATLESSNSVAVVARMECGE